MSDLIPNSQSVAPKRRVFTTSQAADYLGLSAATLNQWRAIPGKGPVAVKMGGRVGYAVEDLDRFIEGCRRTSPEAS